MIKKFDLNRTILMGADLRILLNSDHISYGMIHDALKGKGIFVGNSEKSTTVPLLSSTLLTPTNFLQLIEENISRETRPKNKIKNFSLLDIKNDWIAPLREIFSDGVIDSLLPKKSESIEFSSSPTVIIEKGEKKIIIPYRITRKDYSKDWIQREIEFDGNIVIEQHGNSLKLNFNSIHTSTETDYINNKIISLISKELVRNNIIDNKPPNIIMFDGFDNHERIRFFKRLTTGFKKHLSAGNVGDIEIIKDPNAPPFPDDPQISWMKNTVDRLEVDGQRLNDIFLISDEKYYGFYNILRMNVIYSYSYNANSGSCRVIFSFNSPGKGRFDSKKAELFFECMGVTYNNAVNSESKKDILKNITKNIVFLIEEQFEKICTERSKKSLT